MMLYDDFILDAPVCHDSIHQALSLLQTQPMAVVTYLINTALPLSCTDTDAIFVPLKRPDRIPIKFCTGNLAKTSVDGLYESRGHALGMGSIWYLSHMGRWPTILFVKPNATRHIFIQSQERGAIYRGKWVREVVEQASKDIPLRSIGLPVVFHLISILKNVQCCGGFVLWWLVTEWWA